ncbi:hypothetical protein PFISCL1PPCAC_21271, partial [Pristionchus fissidentatus]
EEAVRQKDERSAVTEIDEGANRQRSRNEYDDEGARRRLDCVPAASSCDDGGLECIRTSSPTPVTSPYRNTTPYRTPDKQWRPKAVSRDNLDHSPEAVRVYDVHPSTRNPQLAEHLSRFGPIVELHLYPNWGGGPRSFAVCRFEVYGSDGAQCSGARFPKHRLTNFAQSDEAAESACRRLHHTRLDGSKLSVTRAFFHYKVPPVTREEADADAVADTISPP